MAHLRTADVSCRQGTRVARQLEGFVGDISVLWLAENMAAMFTGVSRGMLSDVLTTGRSARLTASLEPSVAATRML